MLKRPPLPIDIVLSDICTALDASSALILKAAPGAGKTTRVPLALLERTWMCGKMVVMLEPRRLAARMAAQWMADSLGEEIGQTVGYSIRLDNRRSDRTRILVVTEGVLNRMIQSDPSLEGIGAVIFDEFHERSLHTDLGLALCLDSQQALRPDLRLIVMSATLNDAAVAALMKTDIIIDCPARSFPVETRYIDDEGHSLPTPLSLVRSIHRALGETTGDILVFLPGSGDIVRTMSSLEEQTGSDIVLAPLYGELSQKDQDCALMPAPPGKRKIVLATPIAETSLTVDGVRVVIDSGWRRVSRFDPRSGMETLKTVRIAQSAADQRRGRAGRQGPGICYRLWSESSHRSLAAFETPEILDADLAPLALDLAVWGVEDPDALSWLDSPPAAALTQARGVLQMLNALDGNHRPTPYGLQMSRLAVHPRLASMMIEGKARGQGNLACDIAAFLSERDILRGRNRDSDLRTRLEHLADTCGNEDRSTRNAIRRIRHLADQWRRRLKIVVPDEAKENPGMLLALAYPDRIARRRDTKDRSYLMSNGQRAFFRDAEPLSAEEWLAIADIDGDRANARIFLAAPLPESVIEDIFSTHIQTRELMVWDDREETVHVVRKRSLGALTLKETPLPLTAAVRENIVPVFLQGIRHMGLSCLPWTNDIQSWRQRLAFLRRHEKNIWPDLSDQTLLDTLEEWLAPYIDGMTRRSHLARLDLTAILKSRLDWTMQTRLDTLAPSHVIVPSGSKIPIDYSSEEPVLAVRLQEMFGLEETPSLIERRVPLLLHLLSPARRPVQVTRDLKSFWKSGYHAVKADLMGRYPKHYWPDNPLEAEPTARTKRRPS